MSRGGGSGGIICMNELSHLFERMHVPVASRLSITEVLVRVSSESVDDNAHNLFGSRPTGGKPISEAFKIEKRKFVVLGSGPGVWIFCNLILEVVDGLLGEVVDHGIQPGQRQLAEVGHELIRKLR